MKDRRNISDAILLNLAKQLKAKDPSTLTDLDRDFLTKWDALNARRGLG